MNLGGIYKKDRRNFKLGQYQAPTSVPVEFIQELPLEKLYQNGWPACGSHAGAMFKMIQEYLQTKNPQKFSPAYLWIQIKKSDGHPLDAGTDMISIFKALKNWGVCDYDLLPNDYTLPLTSYSSPEWIKDNMVENAKPRGINSYAFAGISKEELKQAIYQNKAVLLLIRVDNGFFGTTKPIIKKRNYGHFVVAVGYDKRGIIIIDSTETDLTKAQKTLRYEDLFCVDLAGTAIDLPDQFIFTNDLYFGKRGEDVRQLQVRLGMPVEYQTGFFGALTLSAVIKYQKGQGIKPAVGYVGHITRARLNTT